MAEFTLIERIRMHASRARGDVVLGIGDDAAVLAPRAGAWLAVAVDTLVEGVHFPADTPAFDVGWKALAVNLSDLAAMGAEPAHALLALSLPAADEAWVDDFARGFAALAQAHDVALVGGDTTRGARTITVTVHGYLQPHQALRRDGASVGDLVCVTGTLGDAAAGLEAWRAGERGGELVARLVRPTPRCAGGIALRGFATAAIDISDGLLADLAHVCTASGVGADLDIDALPASSALRDAFDRSTVRRFQTAGGDDYEICFTVPPDALPALRARLQHFTVIGRIVAGDAVRVLTRDGDVLEPTRRGYQHFEEPSP